MTTCPFCTLQDSETAVLASNELAYAVLDIAPIRPGHALVMPKAHVEDFFELDAETQTAMMALANELASALKAACRPHRVGMLVAGFDVPHAHLHVVPIQDVFDITSKAVLDGEKVPVPEEALEQMRRLLRNRLSHP
jgi:histidine triad (HIT) family protein